MFGRRLTSATLAVLALATSFVLAGCPARRTGSPADLQSEFLDRA